MTVANTPYPSPVARSRRLGKHLLRAALGLALGVAIAEGAFWLRDRGAFPHLNVYVSDAQLGVRLRPGATERVRFSKNPVTSVRINSEGYRGAEWRPIDPSAKEKEIVVVGDSQVFGLGVEENETFASVLAGTLGTGTVVRNLGVPTYGPAEYNATLEEALAKRPAATIVYVVNLANDLFEATRPNRDRHAVWDGWAVRKETAPAPGEVKDFPGRSLLYGRSHAFYALRRLLHRPDAGDAGDVNRGFASEGSWRDIDEAASSARRTQTEALEDTRRRADQHATELAYTTDSVRTLQTAADNEVARLSGEAFGRSQEQVGEQTYERVTLLRAARLTPGDILSEGFGEYSRDTRITAEHIRRGAAIRSRFEADARAKAVREHDQRSLEVFGQLEAALKKATALRTAPPERVVPMSPLAPVLAATQAIAKKHAARLLVIAFPIDVQVSSAEWAKYGAPAVDMKASRVLLDDVVTAAESVGAEGLDATPALEAAEPGAFLDGDIHMTPKGHRALGEAIAKALRSPSFARPGAGLPAGRTLAPAPGEWTPATEILVRESDPAGCETKLVREWLGIFCRQKGAHPLPAHSVAVAEGREVVAGAVPGAAMLIAPLIPEQHIRATFTYPDATRVLEVTVSAQGKPQIAFEKPTAGGAPAPAPTPAMEAYCACVAKVRSGAVCSKASAPPDADCLRTYGTDCEAVLACTTGERSLAPDCTSSNARAGGMARCRPLCAASAPCARGVCTEWQGGHACL